MLNLAVMFGGRSIEHEISVITALQAVLALDPEKYRVFPVYLALNGKWYTGDPLLQREFYKTLPEGYENLTEITLLPDPSIGGFTNRKTDETYLVDCCLLCFHGQFGEDGCVQGLLELSDLPYTGSQVLSSALTMSKSHTKDLLRAYRIPSLPHVTVSKEEAIADLSAVKGEVLKTLSFPLFIKPNHLGSSIGITKAIDQPSLDRALAKVFLYDSIALVEPYIDRLMEINISILDGNPLKTSVVEIPIASEDALSYEDKYLKGGSKSSVSESQGMAGLTRVINPKDLDPSIKQQVITYASQAFRALNCSGVCRFDFMYDFEDDRLYFNEVNPIPGSLAFYLWDQGEPRMLYTDLLNQMIERCTSQKSIQRSLKRDFGFHALN